jgi:hypothetical protein
MSGIDEGDEVVKKTASPENITERSPKSTHAHLLPHMQEKQIAESSIRSTFRQTGPGSTLIESQLRASKNYYSPTKVSYFKDKNYGISPVSKEIRFPKQELCDVDDHSSHSQPTLKVMMSVQRNTVSLDCKCQEESVCQLDTCPRLGPTKQRQVVKKLIDEFRAKKLKNSVVAIICAKWWQRWQDYTSQDEVPVRQSTSLQSVQDPLILAIQLAKLNIAGTQAYQYKRPG